MTTVRHHPIAAFLTATYILTMLIFGIPLLSQNGIGVLPIELPGIAPFILLSTLSLAATAFVVTRIAEGPAGVRDLRHRAFRFRASPVWYVFAVIALPLSALGVAVVAQGTAPVSAIATQPSLLVNWLIALLVAAVLVNFWEELAWTGFLLHRLQPRVGPVPASVLTTWAQGALHVPLVFIAGGVTDGRVPPDQYPIYLFALFVIPISERIVLTWLYNRSRQSIPVVGIYHASLGIASGSAFLPAVAPGLDPVWAYAGFTALAVVVLLATRGRLGYQHDVVESPPSDRQVLGSAGVAAP
ncbi:MAG: CPBP family intramembrane metalloprotease [Chloroflexi bacterium]|nr:MAG: CPBP family intramembrane metalloprotease [Chloroflexota bacterium]